MKGFLAWLCSPLPPLAVCERGRVAGLHKYRVYNQFPNTKPGPAPAWPRLSHGQNTILVKTPIQMRKNFVKGWVPAALCDNSNVQLCPGEAGWPLAPVAGCLSPISVWLILSWTWGVQSMDMKESLDECYSIICRAGHMSCWCCYEECDMWHVGTRECYQVTSNTRPSQSSLEHSDQLSSSGPSGQSGVTWSLKYYHSDIMLGPFSENSIQFTHKKVASYKTFQYFQCLNFVSIDNLVWFQYCHLCYRCY